MGDYTGMTVNVSAPKELLPHIAEIVQGYYSTFTGGIDPKQPDLTDLCWEGGDVRVGSADELASVLDELMDDGVDADVDEGGISPTPFAYFLWTDPKYEYNGDLWIRVPVESGYLDYTAECDAGGNSIVSADWLVKVVNEASDLAEAKQLIRDGFGLDARDAYAEYVPPPLPKQLTLEVQ